MMGIWCFDAGDRRNDVFWGVTLCSLVQIYEYSEEYVASIFSEEL